MIDSRERLGRSPVSASFRVLLFVICCIAHGCGDLLKQPFPAKSFFNIDTDSPSATAGASGGEGSMTPSSRPAPKPTLQVRAVRVAPPYDGLSFVYQIGPSQFEGDYYVNWIASPATLLTVDLSEWLASGPMTVLPAGSPLQPDYILETNVTRLVIDRQYPAHPRAVLSARFFVTKTTSSGAAVVLDTTDSAEIPAAGGTPSDEVAAWSRACREVFVRMRARLQSSLPRT